MNVAVLYTGALRTIHKTFMHFKRNILLHSNVHVFACLENDSDKCNEEWDTILKNELGENIKSIIWKSNKHDSDWNSVKKINLENIHSHIGWARHYLNESGSMFEHFQMQNAYKSMLVYENTNNIKYEYIVRCRTDTIFGKPIDFHWLNYSDDELNEILIKLSSTLKEHNIMKDIVPYLMYYMINDNIISNISNVNADVKPTEHYIGNVITCENAITNINISELNNYIKHGKYILGFRCNLLYICRREYFYMIPLLGTAYGLLKHPQSDDYWWNSESQFEAICYYTGLSIFNYWTHYENNSVYSYHRDNYFDENNEIKEKSLLFCLVRN
jgi:hypothetical protein